MLHHFPNKQALIFALFARLLAIMEEAISALMAADKTAYGRFTRAYLHYLSAPELTDTQESRQLMVLSLAMPDEPVLRQCWRDWMLAHLAQGMSWIMAIPAPWYVMPQTASGYRN